MTANPAHELYNFSGHETFPVRYAWVPKAVSHLAKNESLFTRDDAMVELGVGKNMVASIRHWAGAFGLTERCAGGDRATELGEKLLGPGGWDPYLEDPGTLWLLHWQLTRRSDRASTWFLAFSLWGGETFSRADLTDWLLKFVAPLRHVRATPGSLKRDVDVFIRTYTPSSQRLSKLAENSLDSPLVELGLVQGTGRDLYRFVRGPQPTLPDAVLTYALTDYWQYRAAEQQTVGFETLLHGKGSPGAVFKLSENALAERLERLPALSGLRFDDTAGMRQLLRTGELAEPLTVLGAYYEAATPTLR